MNDRATFDEDDWADLNGKEKTALQTLNRCGFSLDATPIAKATRVGPALIASLTSKGLLRECERGLHGRYFQLTDKGSLAVEWTYGRKIRTIPE